MGRFSIKDVLDPGGAVIDKVSGGNKTTKDILNIATAGIDPTTAIYRGMEDPDSVSSYLADPMDLFGKRADAALDEQQRVAEGSAAAGISSLEQQQKQIEELYAPYYDQAVSALPQLQAMIMGGDVDYTPSKLYDYQKEIGERNIRRRQASKGQLGSTATKTKLASFYGDLAAEEAERAYGGYLSQVKMGTGAESAVSASGERTATNVGSLYGNLGQQQQAIYGNYGTARQSAYSGLANTLSGLSQYMMTQGG
ncbi:MAG: hypothetical protein GY714_18105 [Desulfobacterales bacterium]|nr:hypothetical protein [Desulfobacterales bacterium]